MQKSEKTSEPFLRKLHYQPTKQQTNHYQQNRSYRTSLILVQKGHWVIPLNKGQELMFSNLL